MQAATRKLQNLLQKTQYSFSGFGKHLLIQPDHTTPISTKITSYPEPTPPINNSTTTSKTKIKL